MVVRRYPSPCTGERSGLASSSACNRDLAVAGVNMNKEAQFTTMLILASALAFVGWALVYLASTPSHPNKNQRATASRFRKWLDAVRHRLLKARD
jgi:hypothetical protein